MVIIKHNQVQCNIIWYCCCCGCRISATEDKNTHLKIKCTNCGHCMVVKNVGRRHKTMEIYAPKHIGV